MQKIINLFILCLFLSFFSQTILADEVYTFIVKKQEEKKKVGWSLESWLVTKEKMKMMDLWLYAHSPSPFEIMLGGNLGNYKNSGTTNNNYRGDFALFAHFAGMTAGYEYLKNGFKAWDGAFNIRLWGSHIQNTNFTIRYGVKSYNFRDIGILRKNFLDTDFTIYLLHKLGIEYLYRYYLNGGNTTGSSNIGSTRMSGDVFLDYWNLRIFGKYWKEQVSDDTNLQTRTGLDFGIKLFF